MKMTNEEVIFYFSSDSQYNMVDEDCKHYEYDNFKFKVEYSIFENWIELSACRHKNQTNSVNFHFDNLTYEEFEKNLTLCEQLLGELKI